MASTPTLQTSLEHGANASSWPIIRSACFAPERIYRTAMNLTRRIDLIGYLHIAYGSVLVVLALFMLLAATVGAFLFPLIASWAVGAGANVAAALILLAIGLPSIFAGIGLIRRFSWARTLIVVLAVIDLFSFPLGTAIGAFSLWILLKNQAVYEFT
jgi:hypothetical protein